MRVRDHGRLTRHHITERKTHDRTAAQRQDRLTGGSRGVGAGIVARLAADGAAVAFTYARSDEHADAVAAAVVASGGAALPIRADSMHEQEVEAAVTRTVERFGSLDILVNNAAVGFVAPITELTMDEIDAMLTINVRSAIAAIRQSLAHMGEGGRIINIGSINADYITGSCLNIDGGFTA